MTRQYLFLSTLWLSACTPTTPGNGPPKADDSGGEPVADGEDETKDTYFEDLDGDGFGKAHVGFLSFGGEDARRQGATC